MAADDTTLTPVVELPRRRWSIAWLLCIGVLVNYFDRVNLSVSSNALTATFGISDVVFGYLSSAYNWTYALCQLPVGIMLDRFGVRRVGRVSIFLWSIASFAAGIAPNLSALFGARFLLGIGEAPIFPSNAKAIGKWFPARERGLATGLFDGAAKFSSAIGVPLIGGVLILFGWRWSFVFTGIISLVFFAAFTRLYRDPEEDPHVTEEQRKHLHRVCRPPGDHSDTPSSVGHLLSQRKVLAFTLGMGSYNYVFYLLLTWLPRYLSNALHIDLLHSFFYTSVPWIFATFTDVAVGGWMVDRLIHRGVDASKVRKAVLVAGTIFGMGILGAAHAHDAFHALLWISTSIGGLSAASPVLWTMPALIVRHNDVGKAGAIANFSGQISGISAPIITGYLVSNLHSYTWVYIVAAVYLAIGIAGYLFLLGRIELPASEAARPA